MYLLFSLNGPKVPQLHSNMDANCIMIHNRLSIIERNAFPHKIFVFSVLKLKYYKFIMGADHNHALPSSSHSNNTASATTGHHAGSIDQRDISIAFALCIAAGLSTM